MSRVTAYKVEITLNVVSPPKVLDNSPLDNAMVPNGKVMAQNVRLNSMNPLKRMLKKLGLVG